MLNQENQDTPHSQNIMVKKAQNEDPSDQAETLPKESDAEMIQTW